MDKQLLDGAKSPTYFSRFARGTSKPWYRRMFDFVMSQPDGDYDTDWKDVHCGNTIRFNKPGFKAVEDENEVLWKALYGVISASIKPPCNNYVAMRESILGGGEWEDFKKAADAQCRNA